MGQEIDLQGWDTANVVTPDVLNAAIAAQKTSPPTFDLTEGTNAINGTWGPWQLTLGRSGSLLEFACPIVKGTGIDNNGKSHDLAGATVNIEIALQAINDTASAFADKTADKATMPKQAKVLLVDPTSTPTSPAVTVISIVPQSLRNDFFFIFGDWFNANIAAFKHIFHAMMLSETAAKGDFQWLKPTDYSYAMAVSTNKKLGAFAALCATDGDPISLLSQQIDVNVVANLPASSNAVLAISGEKLIEHVLKPGAKAVLQGSKLADFDIIGNGLVVTNNKDLIWQDVKLDDGTIVQPLIPKGNFRMRVVEDQIELEFTGMTFKHPLMVGNDLVTIGFTQYYTLNLGRDSKGNQVLTPNFPTITTSTGVVTAQIVDKPTISVTPDQSAQDFDRAMLIVTIAFSILPAARGLYKAGQGIWKLGSAIAAKVAQTAGTGAELALSTDEAAQMSSLAISGSDNLAAAAAMSANLPADARLATLVNRLTFGSGIISVISGIAMGINKLDQNGDWKLDDVPAIDQFMANVLGASKWPGADNWTLNGVELAQSLLLYGRLDVK
ncbi:TULIP family P47-like protein [Bradyrhizobium manausense]|uniref:TULIP family P47-like protein n=1 Tax=Bradyrhizobium TaxID=374 RepID=UPI001BAA44F2|nr:MULTISPECIES: TULIP family P47-like protein [Bradyrhizobium]MBR0828482.1 TULIP family P47-like protein [Bradyrhizobium manausense]UVO25457.1 TULIP family P47-like protein [Bradyrhizobium arachidis]